MGPRLPAHASGFSPSPKLLANGQFEEGIHVIMGSPNKAQVNTMVSHLEEAMAEAGGPNELHRGGGGCHVPSEEAL